MWNEIGVLLSSTIWVNSYWSHSFCLWRAVEVQTKSERLKETSNRSLEFIEYKPQLTSLIHTLYSLISLLIISCQTSSAPCYSDWLHLIHQVTDVDQPHQVSVCLYRVWSSLQSVQLSMSVYSNYNYYSIMYSIYILLLQVRSFHNSVHLSSSSSTLSLLGPESRSRCSTRVKIWTWLILLLNPKELSTGPPKK